MITRAHGPRRRHTMSHRVHLGCLHSFSVAATAVLFSPRGITRPPSGLTLKSCRRNFYSERNVYLLRPQSTMRPFSESNCKRHMSWVVRPGQAGPGQARPFPIVNTLQSRMLGWLYNGFASGSLAYAVCHTAVRVCVRLALVCWWYECETNEKWNCRVRNQHLQPRRIRQPLWTCWCVRYAHFWPADSERAKHSAERVSEC